jgi:heptosyltransferase-2
VAGTPQKILVRAPNWLGDLVMASPALRALHTEHPGAEIILEGPPHYEEIATYLPGVDAFLADPGGGLAWFSRARRLRGLGFDWAVLLPDSVRAALAPFLAAIPVRAGYARDPARRALLTLRLEPPQEGGQRVPISMIDRYLRITRALGCPDRGEELALAVRDSARTQLNMRLEASGVSENERILVVTPGASFGSSKLWPTDHFAKACDDIAKRCELSTVLAPGPGEEAISGRIADRMQTPARHLADPPTSLAELVALIDRAQLVLTNDTGPRHIAVARGCPVVVLMGPTDTRHTAHLLEGQRVLREDVECSPCHQKTCPIDHRCMTRLRPERVIAAAEELLA